MKGSDSSEVVIDGKMMNIGKTGSWRDEIFQINYGADLGPYDPGSDFVRIGQLSANTRDTRSGSLMQGHIGVDVDKEADQQLRRGSQASSASACLQTINENEIFSPGDEKTPERSNCWKFKHTVRILALILLVIAYNAYIAYAIHYHIRTRVWERIFLKVKVVQIIFMSGFVVKSSNNSRTKCGFLVS